MLELKPRQRAVLIEKLFDVANVAVGAMLFGQFLGDGAFSIGLAIGGGAVWLMLFGLVMMLAGETDT